VACCWWPHFRSKVIKKFRHLKLYRNYIDILSGEASIGAYYATCPKKCGFNFNPVCGSNGKSYLNECRLQAAACQLENGQIVLVHKGRCSGIYALANLIRQLFEILFLWVAIRRWVRLRIFHVHRWLSTCLWKWREDVQKSLYVT